MAANPFNGNNSLQYICKETVSGVVNTNPVWEQLSYTGGMPTVTKDAILSATLTGSPEIDDVTIGSSSVTADIGVELEPLTFKTLISSALQVTPIDEAKFTIADITVDDATKTYTRTDAGSFTADGVEVGTLVHFSGLSDNNSKPFHVTAVTAATLTAGQVTKTLTDETLPSTLRVAAKYVTGQECSTFSMLTILRGKCGTEEKMFLTTGLECGSMSFELAVNANVTGTFPMIGRSQKEIAAAPAGSTFIDFDPTDLKKKYISTDGKALVDGVLMPFTSISFSSDTAASPQYEIDGTNGDASFVERDKFTNTVSLSAFMRDTILHNKFLDNVPVAFTSIQESNSGAMSIHAPRVFLTASTPENSASTAITQTLEGTATGNKYLSSIVIQEIDYNS